MRKLQCIQAIANILIAGFAIITFVYTVRQNRDTAVLLDKVKSVFEAQSTPLVKFQGYYQWLVDSPGNLDCEHPAHGINVYFRNVSGVPVIIEPTDEELTVLIGNKPIMSGGAEHESGTGEAILAPGEQKGTSRGDPNFREIYSRETKSGESQINFILSLHFRSMVTAKKYLYQVRVKVLDDCRTPNQHRMVTEKEMVEELKN